MSEALNREIPRLLLSIDTKAGFKNFRKRHYPRFFNDYRDSVGDIYALLDQALQEEDREKALREAGKSLAAAARDKVDGSKPRNRKMVTIDLSSMMVFYVLPGILENKRPEDRLAADLMVEEWKAVFTDSQIKAMDYEEIYGGFRNTILGFNIDGLFNR